MAEGGRLRRKPALLSVSEVARECPAAVLQGARISRRQGSFSSSHRDHHRLGNDRSGSFPLRCPCCHVAQQNEYPSDSRENPAERSAAENAPRSRALRAKKLIAPPRVIPGPVRDRRAPAPVLLRKQEPRSSEHHKTSSCLFLGSCFRRSTVLLHRRCVPPQTSRDLFRGARRAVRNRPGGSLPLQPGVTVLRGPDHLGPGSASMVTRPAINEKGRPPLAGSGLHHIGSRDQRTRGPPNGSGGGGRRSRRGSCA